MPPELSRAYGECRRITAERARSFYLGLRLAPEPERSALYALYAWNRLGDDIVDEPGVSGAERDKRLRAFEESTRAVCTGQAGGDEPLWVALADVLSKYPIDPGWLESMLHGLRRDLDQWQPETLAELKVYCDRVAGSVGRCCLAVWCRSGSLTTDALVLADRLGQAFQITNVLRDIGEDAAARPPRWYMPRELLSDHSLTQDDLLEWAEPDACRAAVLALAAEARSAFGAGDRLLALVRPRFRPTLWAMIRIYERTLTLIEEDPKRSVRREHVRPSKAAAASIACRAFAMSALASGKR
ncbi:MAG: phytoene/squalene synthase family protein [Planctomycetota bacterium]